MQGDKFKNLKKLNDLVLKLSQDVNINNLNSIIEFFQKNKYDIDNDLLDKIKKETDKRKLPKLIDQLKNNTKINYYSSGYICSLFNIFADLDNFCIVEKKFEECVLCKRKEEKIIKPYRLFLTILEEDMKETSLLNILFKKYRSKNINYCKCKEKNPDDLLSTIVKYNINSYPEYLLILFDMDIQDLINYKDKILALLDNNIVLNFGIEYELKGIIMIPYDGHYSTVIFNPKGSLIDTAFKNNNIYIHDSLKNNGKIIEIQNIDEWINSGNPYLAIYFKK